MKFGSAIRAHVGARRKSDDERILPLINIVFLLLIFFMLAGRLAATDPFRIEPPRSASEAPPDVQEHVVFVAADGRLAFDGEVMESAALKAAVSEAMQQEPPPRIRLKADAGTEATQVVVVMETLRDAGVETLRLLTIPAGG